ncbi:MAG: peptidoglycan-binding protein, partial [Abditibacteriales bacterium]|nr:peptidoglycan-binding protein [Abditibacteriales bacterium]
KIPIEAESGTLRIQNYVWPLLIGHLNPMENTPDNGVSGYQARLRNLGYNPGPIDGICGPRTRAAVRAFQRDNPPLEVDGIVGPKTRAKLLQKCGC